MNKIAQDIIDAMITKHLSEEAQAFFIHWYSDEDKTDEDREILAHLAKSNVKPYNGSNLFRGCKKLMNGAAESYSISAYIAGRFAGDDGYVIAIDTERFCFSTFNLSNYIYDLIGEIVWGEKENDFFSEDFINSFDERSAEDEVIVLTDLECSVVMKVHSIGCEL